MILKNNLIKLSKREGKIYLIEQEDFVKKNLKYYTLKIEIQSGNLPKNRYKLPFFIGNYLIYSTIPYPGRQDYLLSAIACRQKYL